MCCIVPNSLQLFLYKSAMKKYRLELIVLSVCVRVRDILTQKYLKLQVLISISVQVRHRFLPRTGINRNLCSIL